MRNKKKNDLFITLIGWEMPIKTWKEHKVIRDLWDMRCFNKLHYFTDIGNTMSGNKFVNLVFMIHETLYSANMLFSTPFYAKKLNCIINYQISIKSSLHSLKLDRAASRVEL